MIDTGLGGKVVLITGANHGIGAAAAGAFATQGARLFLGYYRPASPYSDDALATAREAGIGGDALYHAGQQQGIEPLLADVQAGGGVAAAWEADLGDVANVARLLDRCETQIGPADVLIINHTHCVCETFDPALVTAEPGGAQAISAGVIDAHFAINTRAYALLMAEYLRRYLARGATWGRIVCVSTDAAHAHAANVSYAASKHAIESYSRSAAAEMGRYGVTVNVVAPGPIQTGYITPGMETRIAAETPLGRVGRPQDVADVMVFLASEQAHWLTGQLLYVGGGFRMPQ